MNRIRNLVFTACIAGAVTAATADGTPPPAATPPGNPGFQQLRDPFWPVGYQPATESEQEKRTQIEDLKTRINWPALPLRGVTHAGGRRFIAVIEGIGLVETGDVVVIQRDALIYRWRIDRVSADGVASTRLDVTKPSDTLPGGEE